MIRFLLFGLAVAASTAAFMMYQMPPAAPAVTVEPSETVVQQKLPDVQVLVAKRLIPARHQITSGDFGWSAWPQMYVQPYFTTVTDGSFKLENLNGRYTGRQYGTGEPLDISSLEDQRVERLSDRVSQGMRAVAISVSAQSTAGGFVKVDDYVDIIRVAETQNAASGGSVILENVRVLAVGSSMVDTVVETDTVGSDPGTVTVELSPQQATILAAADSDGRLALALRARADHSPINIEAAEPPPAPSKSDLPDPLSEPISIPLEKPRHSIDVLQGETWVPYEVP